MSTRIRNENRFRGFGHGFMAPENRLRIDAYFKHLGSIILETPVRKLDAQRGAADRSLDETTNNLKST
jgi:hypothetical protein